MGCASSTGAGADIDKQHHHAGPSGGPKAAHQQQQQPAFSPKKNDVASGSSRANGHNGYGSLDSTGGRSVQDAIPTALVHTSKGPSVNSNQHQVQPQNGGKPEPSAGRAAPGAAAGMLPAGPPAASAHPAGKTQGGAGPRGFSSHQHDALGDAAKGSNKERRAAAATDAVREQMRKMAIGAPSTGKGDPYIVSDSEDEDLGGDEAPRMSMGGMEVKPSDITEALCAALKRNFIFAGISDTLLMEVVDRMYGVSFPPGSVVVQQGTPPKPDDCLYYLQLGEAEVVITGAVDAASSGRGGEERRVEGHTARISQKPGWVFGDVALLFASSRTASVVAKTRITVWALDRRTFLRFVMKYATGARALRFLRKLPLLKGLSDNDLIRAASRMPQRVYRDGEALVKYGERGDELFLIRYGKVRVLRPDGQGGRVEAIVLRRGQFVGERAVINDRLRSADCVAQGDVQVVVMRKADFMDLDNPLLAWMLDYDAVSAVLRMQPLLKGLKQEQLEQLLDRFDAREEALQGHVLVEEGALIDRLFVCKIGEVCLLKGGQPVKDPEFVRESGGFTYFGAEALKEPHPSAYTIQVSSETLQMLCLSKRALDAFLGGDQPAVAAADQIVAALRKSPHLAVLSESEVKSALQAAEEGRYGAGQVIVSAASGTPPHVYLILSGEAALLPPDLPLPGQVDLGAVPERGRLSVGHVFNDAVLGGGPAAALPHTLVAATPSTRVLAIPVAAFKKLLAGRLPGEVGAGALSANNAAAGFKPINFADLEYHRVVGTGQFGLVRVVRHIKTNEVYALKVMHKAPITETKQVEHIINERRILQQATHPFCVRLLGAYQDRNSLYLLQEWVPGGELFHHLDIEGAFDEPTAMFFAASVLLALESLHAKDIVYRDLKPENLLLDAQGYIKVADFGFAKFIGSGKTHTICGTPDYQAPEVIMRRGTTKAADYWALGVLIFEMLVGDPPFKSLTGDPWDTFRRTLSGRFYVPNFISNTAADLIFKLLQVNPEKRLGSGPGGAAEIRAHRWFARLDWQALEERRIPAPIKPRVRNPLDTSNFDNFDACDVAAPPVPPERLEKHAQLWELWDWIESPLPG